MQVADLHVYMRAPHPDSAQHSYRVDDGHRGVGDLPVNVNSAAWVNRTPGRALRNAVVSLEHDPQHRRIAHRKRDAGLIDPEMVGIVVEKSRNSTASECARS
ncbi:MAG: hypothetical protein ACRENI_14080 [Gemmatimonadaceae bacterium]